MHFWNWICSYYHVLRFVGLDTVFWTAHFASAVLRVWFEILLCVVNFMWNLCEGTVWFFGNPFELLSSVFDLRSCCGVFFCGIYVGERMIFVKPFRAGVVWVWFEILLWVVHFLWNLCGGTIWSFWDPFDFGCAFNFCGIYYQWRYVFCCTISISCPLHLIWEFFANIFPPVHSICVQICRGGMLGL